MFSTLRNIVRPDSVSGILASLNRKTRQLEALSGRLKAESNRHDAEAHRQRVNANAKRIEAETADAVAAKFKSLTSGH